jgi:choline dehydrogenase
VVVVGAGSGGCVVARRLVDAGVDVLLVEAGGEDTSDAIQTPSRSLELIGGDFDYRYVSVPQAGCEGRSIICPRGKVLGGSSSINGMIYARGDRTDYDAWAYAGGAGWGFDDVLPLFRRSEDFDRGASEYRGEGGPLHVHSQYEPHPVTAAIVEASVQAGLAFNPDYNGATLDGASYIQLNVKNGRRHSAARAFLAPVAGAGNLSVRTGRVATRLLFDGDRCSGVELASAGGIERVRARHEVVLAAGAIDTPKLLLLSGIGPAAALRNLGLEVRLDLPGVGKNLHDHVYAPFTYTASKPVPPVIPGLQVAHAQFFWRSRPGLTGPDIQALIVHLPVLGSGHQGTGDGFSPVPMLVRPASRGELTLASTDPGDAPLIDPAYLACRADVEALVDALELCREIAVQDALAEWRLDEVRPGPELRTRAELAQFVRSTATTNYHHVGTCKLGTDELAVVDPELRVYGIDGLRIADASVMPSVPSANTHGPTVMIGERASDLVAAAVGAA